MLPGCLLMTALTGFNACAAEVPTPEELALIREATPAAAAVEPAAPRKLLVVSLVPTGYVHSAIPYGEAALAVMAEKTGAFEVTITDDISYFEAGQLNSFDAVFLNNANNELFIPADYDTLSEVEQSAARGRDVRLRESLAGFLRDGKGLVALHAALAAFREWDAFGDIIGGRFDNHPWHQEVTIRVEDPGHPLLAAFPAPVLVLKDEIYQVTGPYSRETHRVLLSLDYEQTGAPPKPENVHREDLDFALAWVKPYGRGRVFYCGLGHEHDLFWNPMFLRFLLDGIQFAMGDLQADMTPSAALRP